MQMETMGKVAAKNRFKGALTRRHVHHNRTAEHTGTDCSYSKPKPTAPFPPTAREGSGDAFLGVPWEPN